jgi:hypothetical protein
MKHLFLALAACLCLSGCMIEPAYADPVGPYSNGTVEFCDDYGCRYVTGQYYYDSAGVLFYWDTGFGCWIGPHGYWRGGVFFHGYYPGYHNFYHGGYYHGFHGGGYHGGGHYGGHGGHGGHR